MAAPILREPPVTTATLPVNFCPLLLLICFVPFLFVVFIEMSQLLLGLLRSNRTLPPRWECSIASLIWDSLYVAEIGKVNLPEATTLVASVSAARILGRYSS